jgi:hypothetical protein
MKRDSIVWGIILILIGLGFLAFQMFPDLFAGLNWPWLLIILGVIFLVVSLITRVGGTMIPGVVLMGLGGILLYQTRTGDWASWSYVWTLFPVLAGVGMLLGGLFDHGLRTARVPALIMIAAGALGFVVFSGMLGISPDLWRYWPVILIVIGAVVFFRAIRPRT